MEFSYSQTENQGVDQKADYAFKYNRKYIPISSFKEAYSNCNRFTRKTLIF